MVERRNFIFVVYAWIILNDENRTLRRSESTKKLEKKEKYILFIFWRCREF